MTRPWLAALAAFVVCLAPRAAAACPVCFSGTGENREAYFATFVFLTVIPLLGAGLLFVWLRQRIAMLEAQDLGDPPEAEGPGIAP